MSYYKSFLQFSLPVLSVSRSNSQRELQISSCLLTSLIFFLKRKKYKEDKQDLLSWVKESISITITTTTMANKTRTLEVQVITFPLSINSCRICLKSCPSSTIPLTSALNTNAGPFTGTVNFLQISLFSQISLMRLFMTMIFRCWQEPYTQIFIQSCQCPPKVICVSWLLTISWKGLIIVSYMGLNIGFKGSMTTWPYHSSQDWWHTPNPLFDSLSLQKQIYSEIVTFERTRSIKRKSWDV